MNPAGVTPKENLLASTLIGLFVLKTSHKNTIYDETDIRTPRSTVCGDGMGHNIRKQQSLAERRAATCRHILRALYHSLLLHDSNLPPPPVVRQHTRSQVSSVVSTMTTRADISSRFQDVMTVLHVSAQVAVGVSSHQDRSVGESLRSLSSLLQRRW